MTAGKKAFVVTQAIGYLAMVNREGKRILAAAREADLPQLALFLNTLIEASGQAMAGLEVAVKSTVQSGVAKLLEGASQRIIDAVTGAKR